jgi:NADPH:quinone reductase-like Zn-dependent oxidoreductase
MKAVVYTEYGSPDVLRLVEVAKAVPQDDEVLLQVHAASVNPLDWHFLRGTPYLVRLQAGLGRPKDTRLGVDVAGRVEVVGRNVTQFQPGDEVFGSCKGSFAEYACTAAATLAHKPANVSFEQAGSVAIAALTALQALRDKGRLQPGQSVLINGAAGGVGTYAVQIAKAFGAQVTGVCSTRNVELVRSIGADEVVDYTQADFTRSGQRYDLMLDVIGNHSLADCRRALTPQGTYVAAGGPSNGNWLGPVAGLLKVVIAGWFVSQKLLPFLAKTNQPDLLILQELLASGKVTPVIDRCYPLSETADAIRYLEEGHARGKVVITVEHPGEA